MTCVQRFWLSHMRGAAREFALAHMKKWHDLAATRASCLHTTAAVMTDTLGKLGSCRSHLQRTSAAVLHCKA
jgi:hypothetical protein